jgi:hypothetical protein
MGQVATKVNAAARRVCVLIDADNAAPGDVGDVFRIAETLGDVVTRKLYGGGPVLQAWKLPALKHNIDVVHQYAWIARKNATDMAMTIDAMDLLHGAEHDVYCIMTSDSDFTPLVHRFVKQGLEVHCFGNASAPESLVTACGDRFHEVGRPRIIGISGGLVMKPIDMCSSTSRPQQAVMSLGVVDTPKPKGVVTRSQTMQQVSKDLDPVLKRKVAGAVSASADKDGVSPLTSIGAKLGGVQLPHKLKRVLDAMGYNVESKLGVDYVLGGRRAPHDPPP